MDGAGNDDEDDEEEEDEDEDEVDEGQGGQAYINIKEDSSGVEGRDSEEGKRVCLIHRSYSSLLR